MYVPRSQRMLDQYLQEIGQIPLLTSEQEVDLTQRLKAGDEEAMHQLTVVPLTYLLLYVGSTWRTRFAATEDISYGMYIYGWPIQQLLALAGVGALVPQAGFVVLTIALTAPLAWVSWRLVEKPAMRLGTRPRPTGDLHPVEATAGTPESPRRPVLLGSR